MNKSVAVNVAIAFGRLGLVDPKTISRYLDAVAKPWCISIRILKAGGEKESAFRYDYHFLILYRGFCLMIPHNTHAVLQNFPYLCDSFVIFTNSFTKFF